VSTTASPVAGQLVWRRHASRSSPSAHAIRATCMELLPLVEMFCRWELLEDCNDLHGLLVRFDSEADLETHELGRALLFMIRNDDSGLPMSSPRVHPGAAAASVADPFESVRERLSAVDSAIRTLQPQVLAFLGYRRLCAYMWEFLCACWCAGVLCHPSSSVPFAVCQPRCYIEIKINLHQDLLPVFCQHPPDICSLYCLCLPSLSFRLWLQCNLHGIFM
jgi:hypothetical protein